MIDLKKYFHKNVKLVDTDNKEWTGRVTNYEYSDENYEEKECIDLKINDKYIVFYKDEIKSIEVIENN